MIYLYLYFCNLHKRNDLQERTLSSINTCYHKEHICNSIKETSKLKSILIAAGHLICIPLTEIKLH